MRSYSDFHEVAVDTFMKYVPTCPDFNADDFDTTMDLTYLDVRSGESRNEKRTYPSTCDFVGRALLLKNRAKDGGFVCKDVADWPDSALLHESNHSDSRRADVNIYKNEHSFLWDGDFVDRTRCSDKARVEHAAPNSFALVVIPGECKLVHPGFSSTSSQPFLPDTEAAAKTRSQLCDYITEIQLPQHRSFVYAFYIFRTTVRLMRWDRDGTAVSQPIELKNETEREKFFEFFYCLRNATDTQIEFDPTVTMILPSPALCRLSCRFQERQI
ncbi:hypothetical protein EUX98_g7616 [Antrodiella citrinella]|uniref:Fungal-type protein kinase domain-containing protein n=1 Tax=Antrodiella citrinella TaxID=2447956 RepID=A0A4S4MT97_9APHY|nr:hypothetical protein EUX98_g7616 [Antrodiella citrinella]